MRRERSAFRPNRGELAVNTLQSRRQDLRVVAGHAPPPTLAGRVYNPHRRPLAPTAQAEVEWRDRVLKLSRKTNNGAPVNGAVGRERTEIQSRRKSETVLPVAAKPRRE